MIKSDSIDKIAPAFLKAQMKMGAALKSSANPFFKSKFADLNAVREACLPALNEEGISVIQPTVVVDGKNYVQTVLLHTSGQMIGSLTQVKTLKENDPQAEGSGISYARRYGLQALVNLAAEDDDGEASMGRGRSSQGSAKQSATVTSISKATAIDEQVAKHLNPTPVEIKPSEVLVQHTNPPSAAKTTFRKPPSKSAPEAPAAAASDSEWM